MGWLTALGKGIGKGIRFVVRHRKVLQGVVEGIKAVKESKKPASEEPTAGE